MARGNPGHKKANSLSVYTSEQALDMLRCSKDPVYFAEKYIKVQHPKRGIVPLILYDYQKEMIRGYRDNRYSIVLSARQTGKALDLDTPIPTPTGWTTMGEISPGDFVLGADGEPTKVLRATETMHDHKCYRVQFSNGESIIADAEHLWKVNDTFTSKTVVLTTEEMVNRGNGPRPDNKTCRYSVDNTKPLNLAVQQLPVDPYVLGTWLGDGTSARGEFTVHESDLSIYDTHRSLFAETFRVHEVKGRPHIKRVCVRELNPLLKSLDVVNNKHIPMIYKRGSIDQRIALLQGLMDTDGTVDKTRGGCELTLTDNRLAEDAYELICSLGLKPTMKKRIKSGFTTNSIIFTPYRDEFDVFRIERKVSRQLQTPSRTRGKSTKRRSIISIEEVDSVPVRCISVDNEDNLFLAGKGMIPTHNSTIAVVYLLWLAIFNDDQTILIASNKNAGAMEMIKRIQLAYENLPNWLKPGISQEEWNKHTIAFDNNSRIISTATSPDSGRGLSISCLFLDEFAFVSPTIQEEFWASITPTLSTGGSCIITSTPNGANNLFAKLWRASEAGLDEGGFEFKALRVTWDEPPGRDEAFKRQQIAILGEHMWRQEFECEFLSSNSLLIDSLTLQALKNECQQDPQFKLKEVLFWEKIRENGQYIIGVDPSTGSGRDFSVIQVFSFPNLEQVAEFRTSTTATHEVYKVLKAIMKLIERAAGTVYFSVENNGVGEGLLSLYMNDETAPEFAELISQKSKAGGSASRLGMNTNGKTKIRSCLKFKELVENGTIKIRSPRVFTELESFVKVGSRIEAEHGSTDDAISAILIVIRVLEEIATYDMDAYESLYEVEDLDLEAPTDSYDIVDDDDEFLFLL